jgi:hypothetical protein
MSPQTIVRDWARLLYYLGQNRLSLIGVVLTTSSAITLIGFWVYDFMLPGPPHPYVGILLFLLPGVFVFGPGTDLITWSDQPRASVHPQKSRGIAES